MPAPVLRVITWNLFHGRDGLPGLGPTARSTWLREPRDDGVHLHINRKHTGLMARRIASWEPDLCALQEVPTAGLREIVAVTGMRALWTPTGPLIGPRRLRDALAARNPDLWRSHEGNANVILVGPRLAAAGGARSVRLNPVRDILRAARRLRLEAGELLHYLPEPRRLLIASVRAPDGRSLVVGCTHCHNARHPDLVGAEIARAGAEVSGDAGDRPAILAGDFNAAPAHPAWAALAEAGWDGAQPAAAGLGIDRVVHRGLEVVEPARRLDPVEREVGVRWRGRERRVRLSDHDPVVAGLRLPVRGSAG